MSFFLNLAKIKNFIKFIIIYFKVDFIILLKIYEIREIKLKSHYY
jgi:hypothetical protein